MKLGGRSSSGPGCGIASVAALAGVSYWQAQRVAISARHFRGDSRLWSETLATFAGCSRSMEFGRQVPKCPSPHGRPCPILRCSPSNGTKNGSVRSGTGWFLAGA